MTKEKDAGHDSTQLPDVIVKFHNEVELPYVDYVERYLVDKGLAPWEDWATRFPGISIRRIYVSLPPEEVQELEMRALENNPDFERPYLLRYFRMSVLPTPIAGPWPRPFRSGRLSTNLRPAEP